MKKLNVTCFKGINAIYPFIFFLGIIVLSSCKNDELVGLEVQPDDIEIGYIYTDSTTIKTSTVRDDSVNTSIYTIANLGSYVDPVFGKLTSSVVTSFRLEDEDPGFADDNDLRLDSAVLSFYISDVYADTTKVNTETLDNQTFRVYRLDEAIDEDSYYYSNTEIPQGLTLIGEAVDIPINAGDEDSVTVMDEGEPRQIRIKLDSAIMSDVLKAGASVYASNENFIDYFKGVVIVPENTNQSTGEGAIIRLGMVSSYSRLEFFFKSNSDQDERFELLINENSPFYSVFEHDYTGTTIENVLDDQASGEENLYVQNFSGTAVRVEIPYLEKWAEKGNILINQAMLEVHFDQSESGVYEKNDQFIPLLDSANSGNTIYPVDYSEGSSHYDGEYNDGVYEVNITRHIQQAIIDYQSGLNSNFDLLLVGSGTGSYPQRTVLYGSDPTDSSKRMKLKITYTPL
tara:strand:+ start:962 stop:2332 length:1371 start_codon:yes stop_codon:yes gene_type:complete